MTGDFIWCRKKSCRIVTVRGKPSRQKNPIDLYAETRKIDPKNYDQKYTDTEQKYYKYRKKLDVERSKKWKNVREKSGNSSKQNAAERITQNEDL